jgi:hypothetical protein
MMPPSDSEEEEEEEEEKARVLVIQKSNAGVVNWVSLPNAGNVSRYIPIEPSPVYRDDATQ